MGKQLRKMSWARLYYLLQEIQTFHKRQPSATLRKNRRDVQAEITRRIQSIVDTEASSD